MIILYFQYPAIFGKTSLNAEKVEKFEEALGFLEEYIKKEGYIAADHITIADFAIASTLATIEASGHDLSKFPKTREYMGKLKKEIVDYEELNQKGADEFGAWVKSAIVR
jgi:glutathione S-transferase